MNASKAVATPNFQCELSALVSQTIEIMACYEEKHQYQVVSPALSRLLHRPVEALIGQTNFELAAQPSQSAAMQAYWQQVAETVATVFKTGEAERKIHGIPTSEELQHYETTYTPLKDDRGQPWKVLSISRSLAPAQDPQPPASESRPQPIEFQPQPIETTAHTSCPIPIVGIEMPGLETASLVDIPTAQRPVEAPCSQAIASEQDAGATTQSKRITPKAIASAHQMAEFLKIVLDSIPQYIFWKNQEGVYLGSNQRWADMAGLGDSAQVAGITDDDLPWTQEQKAWYRQCDLQVMETDTPMLRIKQSQRQANGQLSWRETSKFPLHDAAGNVVGLLGTIEDISERTVAEDLLKQSEATFRKLAKQGELLNQLSTQQRQSLKIESIQQITVNEVRQLFSTDRAMIYSYTPD